MFEYTLKNIRTGENTYAYGYNFKNAMDRAHLNTKDWQVEFCDYRD